MRSPYRGHFAVTRSLVEGLRKIGVCANYNPTRLEDVAERVVVLSGLQALSQMIEFKKMGRIRVLLAGPNLVVFPSQARDLMTSPLVDTCIVPSKWVEDVYSNDCPELLGRCRSWPAGVDIAYWAPQAHSRQARRILIYVKQSENSVGPIDPYVRILKLRNFTVDVIHYGSFLHDEYRSAVQKCDLMVGFVSGESQGIAWAEAWAADVPTLLWFQPTKQYAGRTLIASTAPYLGAKTGAFFSDISGFVEQLEKWESGQAQYSPRQWVLENMSDEVCARKLCELAGLRL